MFKLSLLILLISCTKPVCENKATNHPKCDECPIGRVYLADQCAITVAPPPVYEEVPLHEEKNDGL